MANGEWLMANGQWSLDKKATNVAEVVSGKQLCALCELCIEDLIGCFS
jgi:hypothetical protein